MFVVVFDGLAGLEHIKPRTAQTLEEAFAQIACRCGYSYQFEAAGDGWKLLLTNVERPEYSPDPIFSTYIKPRDAKHDLMVQAVDGRLQGHIAFRAEDFQRAMVTTNAHGTRLHVD